MHISCGGSSLFIAIVSFTRSVCVCLRQLCLGLCVFSENITIVLLFHLHRLRSHFGIIEYMAAFEMHVIGIIDWYWHRVDGCVCIAYLIWCLRATTQFSPIASISRQHFVYAMRSQFSNDLPLKPLTNTHTHMLFNHLISKFSIIFFVLLMLFINLLD